jgi:hypothetical protein
MEMSESNEAQDRDAVDYALTKFAANFLRVVAGAGQPHEVVSDMTQCLQALREYSDKNPLRGLDLSGWLDGSKEMRRREEASPETAAITAAEWSICEAALRLIAAQFNSPTAHRESRARSDLNHAIKDLKEAREEIDRSLAENVKRHGSSVAAAEAALAALKEKATGKKPASAKARPPRR